LHHQNQLQMQNHLERTEKQDSVKVTVYGGSVF
jgi:hypothetical protein